MTLTHESIQKLALFLMEAAREGGYFAGYSMKGDGTIKLEIRIPPERWLRRHKP